MIPSLPEIQRAVYGAWRLARFDPGGMACFDVSLRGFWKSFGVAVLVLPFFAYLRWISLGTAPEEGDAIGGIETTVVVELLAYVADWIAFPIAMILVARFLDLGAFYVRYIVALNWSSVIQTAILVPAATVGYLLLPEAAGSMLMLMATVAIWMYVWFVTRAALEINGFTAAALVVLNVLLSVTVSLAVGRLV